MIKPITKQRWQEAQIAERECHKLDFQQGYDHYGAAYAKIFAYLGMETDQSSKTILEVGPADFPALGYCDNFRSSVVIEPMESAHLKTICDALSILVIAKPLEDISDVALTTIAGHEVWCFNTLQHVIDPELFIAKCKTAAPVIRFFEPVDYETCDYHPHTFSQDDFVRWFGECVNRYTDRLPGFFDADCCYGTWRAE